MDILNIGSLSDTVLTETTTKISNDQSKTQSFQSALDKAQKDYAANGDESAQRQLKKACVEMEAYFLNMMFASMRKTVGSSEGLFKKSKGEVIFQEMLDEEYTNNMALAGGIGLADMMYKQLSQPLAEPFETPSES